MDHPGRLALLARALPAIGLSRSAHSRWSREVLVKQADKALSASCGDSFRPICTSNGGGEPRAAARPAAAREAHGVQSTRVTSRPTTALETSEKCARFKENEGHAIEDPPGGKGVKAECSDGSYTYPLLRVLTQVVSWYLVLTTLDYRLTYYYTTRVIR